MQSHSTHCDSVECAHSSTGGPVQVTPCMQHMLGMHGIDCNSQPKSTTEHGTPHTMPVHLEVDTGTSSLYPGSWHV